MQTKQRSPKGLMLVLFIVGVIVISFSPAQTANMVTGTVFMDYNANGVREVHEPGVAGLTITAYQGILGSTRGPTLKNATNQMLLPIIIGNGKGGPVTAVTSNDGKFLLMTTPGEYRLEVTGLAPDLFEGAAGLTTVIFVNDGDSNIDIGVNDPSQYSQTNPDLATSLYTNGLPNNTWPTEALVTFAYENSGTLPEPRKIAAKSEIGSTWGLAYQRNTGTLFSAAFLKRHVGLLETDPLTNKPLNNPLAAIFATDVNAGTTKLFVDLSTLGIDVGTVPSNVARGLPAQARAANNDAAVYDEIGKVGLGDMDISGDGNRLWITNLQQKTLHSIIINQDGTPGTITTHNIPTNQCNGSGEANDARPFAVKVHQDKVYVGVTCSAENTQQVADMHAYVYQLDDNVFTHIVDFALDYAKGFVWKVCPDERGWFPWSSEWPATCASTTVQTVVMHPQPLLSDIEFDDDGSLITGFLDRFGHQGGWFNYSLDPNDDTIYNSHAGGDIRRACYVAGQYVVEGSAPSCPQQSEEGVNFEYYIGDTGASDVLDQQEASSGGLALLHGSGEVVMSAKDPVAVNSSGMITLANSGPNWGEKVNAYQLLESNLTSGFGKANGIGDLELLIDPAPLELGNRLWCDGSNGYALNGIQDPGEIVVDDGTIVSIECDTDGNPGNGYEASATTLTSDGNYLFVDNTDNVTLANGWPAALWDSNTAIIPRNAQCRILIDPTQSDIVDSCGEGGPTIPNNGGGGTGSDMRDSDGEVNHDDYGNIGSTFTTGGSGENDHTLDFGFIHAQEYDWGDLPNSYNTSSDHDGANHVINGLVLGACVDAEADGQPADMATDDDFGASDFVSGTCAASNDDEDGVSFVSTGSVPGGAEGWHDGPDGAKVRVDYPVASAGSCLNGWIDWSRDGTFDLVNEHVIVNDILATTTREIYTFTVPDGTFNGMAESGNLYGRFRLTQSCNDYVNLGGSSATPSGAAVSGEVEDYLWLFTPTAVELFGISVSNDTMAVWPVAISALLLLAGTGLLVARRRSTEK